MASTLDAKKKSNSAFAVFRNRYFTLLWIGQFVSTAGSALTQLAASIVVFRLTNSALAVGLLMMTSFLPSLLIGLLAGVLVDRYNRKTIMIASDLIRFFLIFTLPFLIGYNIIWLFVVILLSSLAQQFFDSANASIFPEIASRGDLSTANSIMQVSTFGSTVVGFAAAGFLSQVDVNIAFFINSFTFLISALCCYFIKVTTTKIEGRITVKVIFDNLKVGLSFLYNRPVLRSLFLLFIPVFTMFGLYNALVLPYTLRTIHGNEFQFGLLQTSEYAGFFIASFIFAGLIDRLREGQWMVIGMASIGLCIGFMALFPHLPEALIFIAIGGFFNSPLMVSRQLVIQRNTSREVRGRVNSAFLVVRSTTYSIGMLLAGLADLVDIRILLFGFSLILIGSAGLGLILPGLRIATAEWQNSIRALRQANYISGQQRIRGANLFDFDLLALHFPFINLLELKVKADLVDQMQVNEVPEGTVVVRQGDTSDSAYFILEGKAVAGTEENGQTRLYEVLNPGDFFGEIAALTGVPRTANVVAEKASVLLQVPAKTLQQMAVDPTLKGIFQAKLIERLNRTNLLVPSQGILGAEVFNELRYQNPSLVQTGVIEPV